MPFLYTNSAGRRFPKKTLTVDVYASRLDQGILTPTTKSLGFKTFVAKTPTSPFFVDEQAYLEVFRSHWEPVIAELAPKYGLTIDEANKIFATSITNAKPALLDIEETKATQKALLSFDPAIIAHGKPVAHLKQNFAHAFANALHRSAATKGFVSIAKAKSSPSAILTDKVSSTDPTTSADSALQAAPPAETVPEVASMATRPILQVNSMPAVHDDPVSAVSETMSPGGVDRAARKKQVLSKLREDAYPFHHEWVFWHERLDRSPSTQSAVNTASSSSSGPTPPESSNSVSASHKSIKALIQDSVQDLRSLKVTSIPPDGAEKSLVQDADTSDFKDKDLNSTNGTLPAVKSSNDIHRYGLANTASTSSPNPDANSSAAPAYEETLVPLMNFTSVKKFWETSNNFDIANLKLRDSVHMFKKTVKPVWEDPRNVRGGSWSFRLGKSISAQAWTRVQLMAIGEALQEVILPGMNFQSLSSFCVAFLTK